MCESIFNSIQLVYDSKYSKQYAASKLSSDLQAVRPNKNIQTNIFGQDNSSEDFVMGIVDKKFDLICPATDKKTHFVGEKHDQESSVPAFSQSDLSNLLHLLLAKCSKNCDMNDHHHSGAVIRDTGIPSCKENQSVCIENAETSPPSEIGSDSYYSLSLFKLNHSHNNQLCQEEITEESFNCERQQQQQSYYSSLAVSAYNCSENSINHQNNNAVSQNQSSSTHYPAECMNDTPNDSSLLVCSQSNTTKSINSVLSSLTSVISDIHSFPPPNQHHLPSSHKSLASYTSSHLPEHEDSSGLFISSSALPPSSSPLKKQLKYTGTAHATSYHNNISSSTSVYSNLSSCGSTTRLPSPSFHKLPNMFIRPSEYNPTEDNFYSKLHNRITNSMQQQGEKQYTTKEQLQYPTRIASISSYNGDNDDNTGVTTTGQKHPNLSFMNTDDFQLHSDESLSRKISASSENVSNAFLSKRINDEISSNHCNKRNTNACVLKEAFNKRITTTNTNTTTTTSTSSNNNSNNIPTQHTKNSNSLHVCIICSRQFSRSDMLLRHAHVHTGHRPFECTICGQAFSRSDHLSTHQRTHTGQRPYQCPLCYYSASRRDMITRHLRVHQRRGHIIPISEGERSKKFYFTAKI
ncbi:unnamed protein product [Heterobilharzia americana]|nr:unnamed protein product [Heterobilharzia americana]